MATFICLLTRREGDDPEKHVVSGGVRTAQEAVVRLAFVSRWAEDGEIKSPFKVVAESDQPVSLNDVDPIPSPLQALKK